VKRLVTAAAASILLMLLSGCGASPGTPSGTSTHSLRVNGVERSYVVTVPSESLVDAPLVIMLHGGFGTAVQAEKAYGWSELAAAKGFLVAFPDGLGRAWNAGDGCCGASGESGVDDVAFVENLVSVLQREYSIDPDRIYVTGMSNGGMMAYRLACDTDLFAAVASVAGTILGSCDSPAPISVLAIHGDADESVRMDGEAGNGAENIDGMPVAEVSQLWREIDDCEAPEFEEADVTTTIASCGDRAVELIVVAGAGHQWPGSTQTKGQQLAGADEPSTALDATATIWEFFAAHPKA